MNIKIDALNYYGATKKYHLHFVGDALFRQLKGGVNTGEAAADNHHVGFNIFPQRHLSEARPQGNAMNIKIDALNYYGATKKYHLHFPFIALPCGLASLKCLITARRAGVEYRPEE
jgi:hypothetical protein